MGLKSSTVGTDTASYVSKLFNSAKQPFATVFSKGYNYGFNLFNKLMSYICPTNYTFYFLVISVFQYIVSSLKIQRIIASAS